MIQRAGFPEMKKIHIKYFSFMVAAQNSDIMFKSQSSALLFGNIKQLYLCHDDLLCWCMKEIEQFQIIMLNTMQRLLRFLESGEESGQVRAKEFELPAEFGAGKILSVRTLIPTGIALSFGDQTYIATQAIVSRTMEAALAEEGRFIEIQFAEAIPFILDKNTFLCNFAELMPGNFINTVFIKKVSPDIFMGVNWYVE